jgi:hypothetical protein
MFSLKRAEEVLVPNASWAEKPLHHLVAADFEMGRHIVKDAG